MPSIGGALGVISFLGWSAAFMEDDELYDPWTDNCETMDPGNVSSPQTGPMPYNLTLSRQRINCNQGVYFTITAPRPLTFTGFMVQARDDRSGEAIGEFDTQFENVKVFNCFGRLDNSAMHADLTPKTEVRLRWAPDSEEEGSVTFHVTVAEDTEPVEVYWPCQRSSTVYVTKAA